MISTPFFRKSAPWLAAAFILALTGCGSPNGQDGDSPAGSASGAPETTDIVFGIVPTPDYAPVQIAIDLGFFEDEGLTVTTEFVSAAQGFGPLLNQSMHVRGSSWLGLIIAINSDVPIVAFAVSDAGTPNYAEFLVKADSPYGSLDDLDNVKVAVVGTSGNCDIIALDALAQQGSDVQPEFVTLNIPDMPAQLSTGGVDAACVPEPTLSLLKADPNFRSIFDVFAGEYEGFPITGFSSSTAFADANPNTIAALQRALAKAREAAAADDTVVRDALKEYTKIPPAAIDSMILPTFVTETDPADLQQVVEAIKGSGALPDATLPEDSLRLR